MHFPNGFAWQEPEHEFACVTVMTKNFGDFKTGWRVWMLEAKGEVCEESVPLVRADWWTGDEMTATIEINVTPVTCTTVCEIGKRQASATSCNCIPVETLPVFGVLYQSHEAAANDHIRVWMKKDDPNMDSVTLRQYMRPDGKFRFVVNVDEVTLECLEVIGEPFSNEYYQ